MKKLYNFFLILIIGLAVGITVVAFTNPSGNPTTGGGALYYSGGFVGIGTTSPLQKFTLHNGHILMDNDWGIIWDNGGNNAIYGNGTSKYLTFWTADSASIGHERMRIDTNGNVGIGTTGQNTALDLNGAFSIRGMSAPAVAPAGQGRIYFDSTANKFKMSENGGGYTDLGGGSAAAICYCIQCRQLSGGTGPEYCASLGSYTDYSTPPEGNSYYETGCRIKLYLCP